MDTLEAVEKRAQKLNEERKKAKPAAPKARERRPSRGELRACLLARESWPPGSAHPVQRATGTVRKACADSRDPQRDMGRHGS